VSEIPWTWFVIRSSGLVAVALLTFSVLLGLLGPRLGPSARLAAITAHRAAATTGAVLVGLHVVLAVLDRWIELDWPAALVPGAGDWQRWPVALGALAVDLLLALVITTAIRQRQPGLWRRVHLVAYPIWALSVGHGLMVATDGEAMRLLALGSAGAVLLGLAVRMLVGPRGTSASLPHAAASPAPAGAPARMHAGDLR
jgi:DMSO/TMAO reductase YedYZ heme-binding membrane subunit